jgi:hypothetical protein
MNLLAPPVVPAGRDVLRPLDDGSLFQVKGQRIKVKDKMQIDGSIITLLNPV